MADEPQDMMEEEGGAPAPSSKSKLSFKTLILIGLPLVMVQALAAYYVVDHFIKPKLPEEKPNPVEQQQAGEEGSREGEVDLSTYVSFPVEDVIVNPAETGGQRYLSLSVNVYVPQENAEMIESLEPEIRSLIIERVSRKRLDQLEDYKDQQILREEIKEDINTVIKKYFSKTFPDLTVPRVVFTKYTIQ